MRTIMLHTQLTEQVGIVEENGRVSEVIFDRPEKKVGVGAIYKGKVMNVNAGLQAAFIDIGEEKQAFLRKEEIPWAKERIESSLREGEALYVQVLKEPFDDKGAQVSADVTIPGLYSVYQPFGAAVSVSRKISQEQGEELKVQLARILTEDEGAIIRTAASRVECEELLSEVRTLKDLWQSQPDSQKPRCILEDQLIPDQLLRKFPIDTLNRIIVDDVNVANQIRERFPAAAPIIHWHKQLQGLSINEWQQALTSRIVPLENGIEIVIDRTEAMTVIDVNSSRYRGRSMTNSHTFDVNKQAADEIARQIRLRNLSGMIIIDFLSMRDKKLEQKLVQHMKKEVLADPVKTAVFGMTKLGLMELTRKRDRVNLMDLFTQRHSNDYTMDTHVYRMERDLLSKADSTSEAILLAVHPDLLQAKKRLLSDSISSKIPQELFVRQEGKVPDYQIELEGSEDMVREAIENRGYYVDNLF